MDSLENSSGRRQSDINVTGGRVASSNIVVGMKLG